MDSYNSKPLHFLLPIFLFMLGVRCVMAETVFLKSAGIGLLFGAFGAYIVILVAGVLPHYSNYWREINRFAELMLKNHNPELWAALGFHSPYQKAEIVTREIDNGPAYPHYERTQLPVSDAVMAVIARGVVVEGVPFSETEWVTKRHITSGPKFRQLQDIFEAAKYIRQNHPTNSRLGYSPTHKGAAVLYQYAALPLPTTTNV